MDRHAWAERSVLQSLCCCEGGCVSTEEEGRMSGPVDIFGRYKDDAPPDLPWCDGGLVLEGAWYPCDLIPPHDGWAHSNREVEAIWK